MYASMSQSMAMELDEVAKCTSEVVAKCEEQQVETTQDVQNIIEEVLEESNPTVKKSYVLYKKIIDAERNRTWNLTPAGEGILHNKYLKEGEDQQAFFKRIALGNKRIEFILRNKIFLPGGRILAGIGDDGNVTTSNCYYIPIKEDSVNGIMSCASDMAETYKTGGGVGISLESLRPRGFAVNNSAKTSTGSVSFANIFDAITGTIGQKGRRGALMLSHSITHPDIDEFISLKEDVDDINNANISIKVTENFMDRAIDKKAYYRVWKDDKNDHISMHSALGTLESIAAQAHATGEPGILYWDKIAHSNYISDGYHDYFKGTNPCGELPLNDYGACLLSAINLSEMVTEPYTENAELDIELLVQTVHDSIRYMNQVLDLSADKHALKEQRENALGFRPLGLGIMGLHDMLLKLDIEYGSDEAIDTSRKIAYIMLNEAVRVSATLAQHEGPFPKWKPIIAESKWLADRLDPDVLDLVKQHGLRNAQLLTVAPTGSTSTMLDVSGGIEPFYATSYKRKVESFGEDIEYDIMKTSVREYLDANPDKKESDIVTAQTLHYEKRIKMQGAFQYFFDNAISSTINLPEDATVEDVLDIYIKGYKEGLKGLTVYRDNCGRSQILTTDKEKEDENKCPKCGGKIIKSNGCESCEECGFGLCSI